MIEPFYPQDSDRVRYEKLVAYNRGRLSDITTHGLKLDGTNEVDAAQNAVNAVKSAGGLGLWLPGMLGIDVGAALIVPDGFVVASDKRGGFRGLGTAFADQPAFPFVGQALVAVGNSTTGRRYGTETGRRALGTGATFNLTVSSGSVTAIAVASGGNGYRVGDRLNFGNGTVSYVTGVNNFAAGVITSVVVDKAGSGWGGNQNALPHTNTTALNAGDRLFDVNSFASRVDFYNLVFDGGYGYGNTQLTGTKNHNGIDARGVLNITVEGCSFARFPGTGAYLFDCKNGRVIDNVADDCGWAGVIGRSRNGFSNVGLYTNDRAQAAVLNTEYWIFERNVARKIGDVGAQFSLVENATVRHNQLLGCGTIGIEGESSSFNVWDTYAGNNGVKVPGNATITDNVVDGLMLDGTLATDNTSNFNAVAIYALNGISWTQGNEGTVREGRNIIANHTAAGLKIIRNSGGKIVGLGGTEVRNCNQGNNPAATPVAPGFNGTTQATGATLNNAQQAVLLVGPDIKWNDNVIGRRYSGPGLQMGSNAGPLNYVATDNDVEGASSDNNSPSIYLRLSRGNAARIADFSRNRFETLQTDAIKIEVSGGNTVSFSDIRADDVTVRNGNRANVAGTAAVNVTTSNGGTLNFLIASVDRLHYVESSLSGNAAIPVKFTNTNTFAPNLVSISNMIAPQFATKHSIAMVGNAPASTRLVNNV